MAYRKFMRNVATVALVTTLTAGYFLKAVAVENFIAKEPTEIATKRIRVIENKRWVQRALRHFQKRALKFGEEINEEQLKKLATKLNKIKIYLTNSIERMGEIELYGGKNYLTEIHVLDISRETIFHELYHSIFPITIPALHDSLPAIFSYDDYARWDIDIGMGYKLYDFETRYRRIAYLTMKCVGLQTIIDACLNEDITSIKEKMDEVLGDGTFDAILVATTKLEDKKEAEKLLKTLIRKILEKGLPLKKWLLLFDGARELMRIRAIAPEVIF